jgi:hypothetical protein
MSALPSLAIDAPLHEQPWPSGSVDALFQPSADHVCIRGVQLPLAKLVDRSFFAPERCAQLREQLANAKPFPHLVLEGLFHPALLELVAAEFDDLPKDGWADIKTRYESTRRSVPGVSLQPASQLYFDIVGSGWFSEWLTSITGVPYLLTDPKLIGGGLHESRNGATFAVHRDFNRHREIGLRNAMVFITYLNKGWDQEWGSALELWDKKADRCVTSIQPEFGRTVLLPHGPVSYHGHTKPLQTPDGRPRRSVAAYFYTSPVAGKRFGDESASKFMRTTRLDRAKAAARLFVPPIVWMLGQKLLGR